MLFKDSPRDLIQENRKACQSSLGADNVHCATARHRHHTEHIEEGALTAQNVFDELKERAQKTRPVWRMLLKELKVAGHRLLSNCLWADAEFALPG